MNERSSEEIEQRLAGTEGWQGRNFTLALAEIRCTKRQKAFDWRFHEYEESKQNRDAAFYQNLHQLVMIFGPEAQHVLDTWRKYNS